MEIAVKVGQFLLSLSILIVLHELGHFVFARMFHTRVEKFFLFFDAGFALFKKKIGDTVYGIGWLPLGGYVKISGMIDESMDKEQMKKPPQPWEFRSKKAWQRLLIMLGGVTVNFLLAIVIYILVFFTWGEKYVPNQNLTYGIMVDSIAMDMGLRNGDKILALDGVEVKKWESIHHDIIVNEVETITVNRNEKVMYLEVPQDLIPKLLKTEFPILPRVPACIGAILEESPADSAGLQAGDYIVALNGQPVYFYDEFLGRMVGRLREEVRITVTREKDTLNFNILTDHDGKIGFYPLFDDSHFFESVEVRYSFLQSIPAGIKRGYETTRSYLKQLKMLIKPKTKAYEELGGFIKIGSIFPSTWDWQSFWNLTAFLSIILAIMNILPIPALDGGHVMFLLFEMITGRKPGDKFLEYAQIVGMVILLSLLLYANLNDIIGLFNK
ncbi:MAG: RIP metalloprotease RseP [Bacteroidales bacterium]|nr:RIP metalloprotease RseP [Bacteroidales bacterium]